VWWCGEGGVENEENCGPKASRAQTAATGWIGNKTRVLREARGMIRALRRVGSAGLAQWRAGDRAGVVEEEDGLISSPARGAAHLCKTRKAVARYGAA